VSFCFNWYTARDFGWGRTWPHWILCQLLQLLYFPWACCLSLMEVILYDRDDVQVPIGKMKKRRSKISWYCAFLMQRLKKPDGWKISWYWVFLMQRFKKTRRLKNLLILSLLMQCFEKKNHGSKISWYCFFLMQRFKKTRRLKNLLILRPFYATFKKN
jgi:hypothetical protein